MQFNDPNWARAASNLAAAFAPPSGRDAAGFAQAGYYKTQAEAERANMQRLQDLWSMGLSPDFNQDTFDRMGQAAGQWNPNQGYYAVNTQADTTRRGQDVQSQTALATNAANNARALQQTRMNNQASFIGDRFSDISPGNMRPGVPDEFAAILGLPGFAGIEGPEKPLTETQWNAQQSQRLLDEGALTDRDIMLSIMGSTPVEQIVGSDGQPQFAYRPDAVGQRPVASGDTSAAEDRIGRLAENLLATGTVVDPQQARIVAVGIVDGRLRADRDPITRDMQVVDMATGEVVFGGSQNAGRMTEGTPAAPQQGQFGTPYADPEGSFGVEGAWNALTNSAFDALGMDMPYPEASASQRDFGVLREDLLNDMASAYNRQPPSWLLQEIRSLTPSPGQMLEGPGTAVNKLQSLGRRLESELNAADEALGRELSPSERQRIEAQRAGLQRGVQRVQEAMRAFERGRAQQDAVQQPAQQPAQGLRPGDVEDGFRYLGGDPGDMNSWERVE